MLEYQGYDDTIYVNLMYIETRKCIYCAFDMGLILLFIIILWIASKILKNLSINKYQYKHTQIQRNHITKKILKC